MIVMINTTLKNAIAQIADITRHKTLGLILFSLLTTACQPIPVYENKIEWIPAPGFAGQACSQECATKRLNCQRQCSTGYQQCYLQATEQAEKQLPIALQSHQISLNNYYAEKRIYDFEIDRYERENRRLDRKQQYHHSLCQSTPSEKHHCEMADSYRHQLNRLHRPHDYQLNRPTTPTLQTLSTTIASSACDRECGCENNYTSCFVGCGGKVIQTPICVENCTEE